MYRGLTLMLIITVVSGLFFSACKKEMIRDAGGDDKTISDGVQPENDDNPIDESYLKEGYLPSKDIYRSIILAPRNGEDIDEDEIRNKAENKFMSGIQNKLKEKNIVCDRNKRIEILRIIENDSTLSKNEDASKTDIIYYFDIKNFRKNLNKIMCEPR